MQQQQLAAKVREYEQFANDVLKADLQRTVTQRAQHQAEIAELEQLRRNIQHLLQERHASKAAGDSTSTGSSTTAQTMKSQVELGSGVFCRAVVPDTSRIFISIGLGFHVEATLQEAGRVIDLQQQRLQGKVDAAVDKAARLKAHLKFVAEAIRELTMPEQLS